MAIDIKTVDPAGLDGIAKAKKPDGLYMALADPKLMFWRAVDVRNGRVSRNSGAFPEVLNWLFLRAKVFPRGRQGKNRIVGTQNPWKTRVVMPERERIPETHARKWRKPYVAEEIADEPENDRREDELQGEKERLASELESYSGEAWICEEISPFEEGRRK